METKTYKTLDRSGWGHGEWDDEPDKVQWPDEETGLPCLAVRSPSSGAWCGYVGVDASHTLFEVDYMELNVDVHGGLTYSDFCRSHEIGEGRGICHVPGDGEPHDVWWLGFDCSHYGDLPPFSSFSFLSGGIYRTLDYVQDQCRKLARQLAEVKNKEPSDA
jgi:hypothetical protein